MNKTEDKDRGRKRILKDLDVIDNAHVLVGLFADAQYDDGLSVAEIMAVHEYGSKDGKIPERSFIRSTDAEKDTVFEQTRKEMLSDVLRGVTGVRGALMIIGEEVRAAYVEKIKSGVEPELAEVTKERKGSSLPLVDTGTALNSIKQRVVM